MRGDGQRARGLRSNLSSNFARDLDKDTIDVFVQTSKTQVILIELIYDPKLFPGGMLGQNQQEV